MTNNHMIELLTLLTEIQKKTAPIELSIGTTTDRNMIVNDVIVITDAPPVVVERLIENGYMLDITKRGVIVNHI